MTFTETPEELQVATDAPPDIEVKGSGDSEYSSPVEFDNAEWQSKDEQNINVSPKDRRSSRLAAKNQQAHNFCAMQFVSGDPDSVIEAMQSNCSAQWKDAMKDEYESLNANKTWKLVNLPADAKAVRSKCIFKTKREESGDIVRWKAVGSAFTYKLNNIYTNLKFEKLNINPFPGGSVISVLQSIGCLSALE